jgi:hypothetical protein
MIQFPENHLPHIWDILICFETQLSRSLQCFCKLYVLCCLYLDIAPTALKSYLRRWDLLFKWGNDCVVHLSSLSFASKHKLVVIIVDNQLLFLLIELRTQRAKNLNTNFVTIIVLTTFFFAFVNWVTLKELLQKLKSNQLQKRTLIQTELPKSNLGNLSRRPSYFSRSHNLANQCLWVDK